MKSESRVQPGGRVRPHRPADVCFRVVSCLLDRFTCTNEIVKAFRVKHKSPQPAPTLPSHPPSCGETGYVSAVDLPRTFSVHVTTSVHANDLGSMPFYDIYNADFILSSQ